MPSHRLWSVSLHAASATSAVNSTALQLLPSPPSPRLTFSQPRSCPWPERESIYSRRLVTCPSSSTVDSLSSETLAKSHRLPGLLHAVQALYTDDAWILTTPPVATGTPRLSMGKTRLRKARGLPNIRRVRAEAGRVLGGLATEFAPLTTFPQQMTTRFRK